jgi:hypothetical protein
MPSHNAVPDRPLIEEFCAARGGLALEQIRMRNILFMAA